MYLQMRLGFGGVVGTQWFAIRWSDDWLSYHITLKECFPFVVAIEIWGNQLRNKRVTFFTDNIAVVYIINKHTSKHKLIMKLVHRFVLLILKYNIFFKASHIAGINNTTLIIFLVYRWSNSGRISHIWIPNRSYNQ